MIALQQQQQSIEAGSTAPTTTHLDPPGVRVRVCSSRTGTGLDGVTGVVCVAAETISLLLGVSWATATEVTEGSTVQVPALSGVRGGTADSACDTCSAPCADTGACRGDAASTAP